MDHRAGFLAPPDDTPDTRRMYDDDLAGDGYVMNLTRVWAHEPALQPLVRAAMDAAVRTAGLSQRQRAVLVSAAAATLHDSYCSLAWGQRLATEAGPATAAAVLSGSEDLEGQDRALARWARQVAADPNATTPEMLGELRSAGFDDRQILGLTTYVAMRVAFSTVNDALGAAPDRELLERAAPEVLEVVTYGRPAASG